MEDNVEILNATDADIIDVVSRCRDADRIEFEFASEDTIEVTVMKMRTMSHRCLVGKVDGVAVCVFGVIPKSILASTDAYPWMICAKEVEDKKHRSIFLRMGGQALIDTCRGYKDLYGVVHERNRLAIRWLTFMGFHVDKMNQTMIRGGGFYPFKMERN